jgi:hypothetical protein
MSNIPLVNNNSIDAINTSIIAIKKNLNNNDQIQDVDVNVGINIATNCTYCAASSTTIKGAQLYNGCSIKVLFTSAITGSDTTTPMSINYNDVSIPVKTGKNGVLSNFVANNIDGSYIYCQAYTTLELLFDGTQFIIMGNPVVISSADYTIYTDGSKKYNEPYFQPNYFKYDEKTFQTGSLNLFVKICSGTETRNLTYIDLEASRVNTTGCWQRLYFTTYSGQTLYQLVKFFTEKYAHGNVASENEANFLFAIGDTIYAKIASYSSGRVRLYTSDGRKIDGSKSTTAPSGTRSVNGYSATPIIQ